LNTRNSQLKEKISKKAQSLGFSLIAFTDAKISQIHSKAYKNFLKNDMSGDLDYLKNSDARLDPNNILPELKTVICLATNYFHEQKTLGKDSGRIARYAYGRDYHKIIKKRLVILEEYIRSILPESKTRSFVDAVPFLERAFAEKSGLGIIGKNSCLITKKYGSWVFLSEILLNKKITPDKIQSGKTFDICGSCELCMQVCPNKAIISPGIVDPMKCLSFWTIENKSEKIPAKIKKILKETNTLFGCDKCQECCPHNSRAIPVKDKAFKKPKIAGDEQNVNKLLAIKDEEEFLKKFAGSAFTRAKFKGIKRNAKAIRKK